MQRLTVRRDPGEALADDEIDACYALVTRNVEQVRMNRDAFAAGLRGARTVRFLTSSGALTGMYVTRQRRLSVGESEVAVLYAGGLYFDAAARGNPALLRNGARDAFAFMAAHALHGRYFTGVLMPSSYAYLRTKLRRVWTWRGTDTPPEGRALVEAFYGDGGIGRWDPERGVVWAALNVAQTSERARARYGALIEEYEALNPWWREGAFLPVMMPLGAFDLLPGLLRLARREARGLGA